MAQPNPYDKTKTELKVNDEAYTFFDLSKLNDERLAKLPYSIKILLESAVRNCDNFVVKEADVEKILDWKNLNTKGVEIPFKPARVLLQDFTGVPSVVDLAAMRSAVDRLGGDADAINPLVPVDLVIDHSVQVDVFGTSDAAEKNTQIEIKRNAERFQFLKWGSKAFKNFRIVPPGSGIVHQVNLEYLGRVVFDNEGLLYPDSLVGTDSHTTMIDGLGVAGWGVGGLEAEAVMLGQAITMVLPEVVGFRLNGTLGSNITATDLVLRVVEMLRQFGVVGKFVEFFGEGLQELSLADRATIANMAPEYGATMGFFPVDKRTIAYLENTNRSAQKCAYVEQYLRSQGMYVDYEGGEDAIEALEKENAEEYAAGNYARCTTLQSEINRLRSSLQSGGEGPEYTAVLELDLSTVVPSVSGPKRPHDRINVDELQNAFRKSLTHRVGFKGFGLKEEEVKSSVEYELNGEQRTLSHGAVVIAAITSCTNTSNPSVMIGAGLVCKKAFERGLNSAAHVKTSLAPGSHVVTSYLGSSGLQPFMDKLGFTTVGYGCTSCIGNSGDLIPEVSAAIEKGDLVASAVLSGNRNFEGRVHSEVRAAFLASPPLVVAYAIAGTVDIDLATDPLGKDQDGNDVFLKDIWPTNDEIQEVVSKNVLASMFKEVYSSITDGTPEWNALPSTEGKLYPWDDSTYIHHPPFFQTMERPANAASDVKDAYVLLNLGDSITTDHISPAGRIAPNSPAAKYLEAKGVERRDWNTYGARRGNDEVMARGTFANIRLVNKFCDRAGPYTVHIPSGEKMAVFDAAMKYKEDGNDVIILGGKQYGGGSSRDWAAKGPHLQGVKAVIVESFERIHRSNLAGMGIVPLTFLDGENAETFGLTGKERFSIDFTSEPLQVGQKVKVKVDNGKEFDTLLRLDTAVELEYFKHGGILHYVIRELI